MLPSSHRFTVGAFACTAVADGTFPYPPPAFAANVPAGDLERALRERGRPTDQIVTPYTCLLIDTGRHRVLVDTGAGRFPPDWPQTTGNLVTNLRAAGVDPAEIDTVILSHGHADHIGGNLDASGKPAFPNARFVMQRAEWEFWTSEPSLDDMHADEPTKDLLRSWARNNLPPIHDRVDLIEGADEIVPGVRAIPAPGHTPAHMGVEIASDGDVLLDLVDTALDPLLLEHPTWTPALDLRPEQAAATRRRLLDRAADERALVLLYHFPFPGLGRITHEGAGWRWDRSQPGETFES